MKTNKHLNNKKTILDIGIISIFPEMFKSITEFGITGNAIKNKIININYWNPRDFCYNKNKNVDDRPYGGGPGMIMNMLPLYNAIQKAKNFYKGKPKVIYLSPQGKKINNRNVTNLLKNPKIILVCGRYKGVDERLIDSEIDEEWSIGDYVLTGGELPAMILIDVILRFIPGVLRKKKSMQKDSFYHGLLDHPHYTRPSVINGRKVPDILLSGNHAIIKKWRIKESLKTTLIKRPDLLKKKKILKKYKSLLQEILNIK